MTMDSTYTNDTRNEGLTIEKMLEQVREVRSEMWRRYVHETVPDQYATTKYATPGAFVMLPPFADLLSEKTTLVCHPDDEARVLGYLPWLPKLGET